MTDDQLATIWKSIQADLEAELSPAAFKTWFNHSRLTGLRPGHADLAVENLMSKNFIVKYAQLTLLRSLSQHAGFPVTVVSYTASPSKSSGPRRASLVENPALFTDPVAQVYDLPERQQPAQAPPSQQASEPVASNLNPKYTFDSFIVGNRNRLAHAAARAVADRPGTLYNPLYLYGGVGLGKTHLMQAVGNEIVAREPQKRVLYISCESFLNEWVTSIKGGKQEGFKKKYRTVDVFLVDDIQFIAGKEGTQEEFFHTFNSLYQSNRQIVMTSDKVPADIKGLEDRLSSRFSSGMIADIQLPDLETRQAILQAKCQEKGITLPDSALLYIADQVESNIRELEGALTTVLLHLQAAGAAPTNDQIQLALRSFTAHKPAKKSGMEQLREVICQFYDVDFEDIKGPRRQQELVKPRKILMYLLKHELGMTFPAIGREIGGRDHTTAMHSVDKIEKELKKSPELFEEMQRIKEAYYAGGR